MKHSYLGSLLKFLYGVSWKSKTVTGKHTLEYLVDRLLINFLKFDIQKKLLVDLDESFKCFVTRWELEGIMKSSSHYLALEPLELATVQSAIVSHSMWDNVRL
jgi:hypothetical protein